jgi:phosphoglycerol transferase MdoB-like AlkP superfamily enzyme
MRFFHLPKVDKWVIRTGLVFVLLMTLTRVIFYFFFNNQGNPITNLVATFFLGLRFDFRSASLLVLPIFLLARFSPLNPFTSRRAKRGWMIYWGIASLLLVFFYVVDFAHYAYLGQRLNASILNYLQDAGISMDMVWQSYPVLRLVLLLAGGTLIITWIINRTFLQVAGISGDNKKKKGWLGSLGLFFLIAFFLFGRFNQYPLRWSDAFGLGNDYKANLALNPFESFFNTLKFRSTTFDEKKVKELYPVLAKYYDFPANSSLNFSRTEKGNKIMGSATPNIILVICESFSAYKSSMWNNPLNTTPFFDSISKKGIFFDHCFTPSYGTARGVWATLTGVPDVEMPKTSSRNPLAVDQHIILNDLTGYEKYYFIGGSPSWANIRGLLMNNISGLHMYDQEVLDAPRLDVWGISDKNLFLESNKILAKESNPFFAIIQTADNHRPYTIPEEDTDFLVRTTTEDSLNRFGFSDQVNYSLKLKEYNAFRYTDYTFQQFMQAAAREKYFDNTIFVFVGDHGIPGDAGTMFSPAWTAQRLAAEHVPLLFYSPRLLPAQRNSIICSQVDIMPTIAGFCTDSFTNTTLGRNLLDSNHRHPFAFIFDPDQQQSGVIMGDYYYRKHLQTGKEEMVPIKLNKQPGAGQSVLPIKEEMKRVTDAIYQCSRYLLLNNKKKNQFSH